MIQHSVPSTWISCAKIACLAAATALLAGCAGMGGGGNYHSTAYAPMHSDDVRVKVSLKTQNVYVEEGSHMLMKTPTCVGKPGYPTPLGHYAVTDKIADKRSSTYGYWVRGDEAHPGESSRSPGAGWHYVGYPMAFWVEFTPGFGFHEGPIWPYPRSHGCLHLHETASAKFFKLVHVGTPVTIAESLPEDSEYHVDRPSDYADPDPAPALMISPHFFTKPRETELEPSPGSGTPTAATAQGSSSAAM